MIRRYAGKFEVSVGCGAGAGFEAGALEAPGLSGCIGGVVGSLGAAAFGFTVFEFTAPLGAAPVEGDDCVPEAGCPLVEPGVGGG